MTNRELRKKPGIAAPSITPHPIIESLLAFGFVG
jgi:hypothetical protein